MGRRNHIVVAAAQANPTARIIWALLAHDRQYDAGRMMRRLITTPAVLSVQWQDFDKEHRLHRQSWRDSEAGQTVTGKTR